MSIIAISSGQVDKIVVAPLLGFTILGNYNLAVQVINIMLIVPSVFYKYLLPQESTGIENKKPKHIDTDFRKPNTNVKIPDNNKKEFAFGA